MAVNYKKIVFISLAIILFLLIAVILGFMVYENYKKSGQYEVNDPPVKDTEPSEFLEIAGIYKWEKDKVNIYLTLNENGTAYIHAYSSHGLGEKTRGTFILEDDKIIYTRFHTNLVEDNWIDFNPNLFRASISKREIFEIVDSNTLRRTKDSITNYIGVDLEGITIILTRINEED